MVFKLYGKLLMDRPLGCYQIQVVDLDERPKPKRPVYFPYKGLMNELEDLSQICDEVLKECKGRRKA